jgi:putative transposase
MHLAHKIRIFPSREQEILLRKSCGVSRFAYNWALAKWKDKYQNNEKVNEGTLRKELNSIKRKEFPWMLEVTKCSPQQAIKDLGKSFSNFFKKRSDFPKFHKKGIRESYYLDNISFKLFENEIRLATIGKVRMAEKLRLEGKLISATVSLDVDRWYVSIIVDTEFKKQRKQNLGVVGIDLGISKLATCSDGTVFENPKFYDKAQKRIKRLQQSLQRKQKGSSNRKKAKILIGKSYRKVRLARKTNLQKISTYLCENYNTVVIEDLNVKGMVKNHKLARSISDCGFGTFRLLMENKSKIFDTEIFFANRFFPSSKTCSNCKEIKKDLKLSDRTFKCNNCGLVIDRDLNAAINLKKLGTCCSEVKPVERSNFDRVEAGNIKFVSTS